VTGVVHDHIETAGVLQDVRNARGHRCIGLHVQFDRAQIERLFLRPLRDFRDARRVAALRFAHRRVDGMARFGQRTSRHQTKSG
jgi:hypothetical protein